jgi:hypothetical protein
MTDAHCDTLMKLHLNNFPPQTMTDIKKRATFIFANREPMIQHNTERLREQHSDTNPVARIKAIIMDKKGVTKKDSKHLAQEQAPKITNICRNAKVQLTGRNLEPDWGLYNGAIGTVKEIVYEVDQSPIDGHLPQFVIVEFPQYCGPVWMQSQPKVNHMHTLFLQPTCLQILFNLLFLLLT